MAPDDIARVVLLRLAGELADERASLDRLAVAVDSLLAPAPDERGEWMRTLALAFEIERYYTAVESMLARVLKNVDESLPEGPGSHQELLRAAAVPVDGLRPAVISAASAADLRELLRFRHLARHGYDVEPELPRMAEHAARVARLHAELGRDWAAFDAWLRSR